MSLRAREHCRKIFDTGNSKLVHGYVKWVILKCVGQEKHVARHWHLLAIPGSIAVSQAVYIECLRRIADWKKHSHRGIEETYEINDLESGSL